MKFLKWLVILVVAVLVIGGAIGVVKTVWLSSHGSEIISGSVREGFVESSTQSCISAQSASKENANVSHDTIVNYCACVSNKMADQLTNDDIASFPKDDSIPAEYKTKIAAASQACLPQ